MYLKLEFKLIPANFLTEIMENVENKEIFELQFVFLEKLSPQRSESKEEHVHLEKNTQKKKY